MIVAGLWHAGEEPADLLAALAPAGSHGGSSTCQSSSCCTRAESAAASGEPSGNNLAGAAAAAAAAAAGGGQLPAAADDGAAAAAVAGGGWPSRQQQQEEQGDGDVEMTPSSAAGEDSHAVVVQDGSGLLRSMAQRSGSSRFAQLPSWRVCCLLATPLVVACAVSWN